MEGHPRHVEPQQQPGPPGDDLEQGVQVVREGQVPGGVDQRAQARLALLAAGEERPDAQGEVLRPFQPGEVGRVRARLARRPYDAFELLGACLPRQ
ncbi:hypothetical protein ACWCYZ_07600 [Streptomyces virginiae]